MKYLPISLVFAALTLLAACSPKNYPSTSTDKAAEAVETVKDVAKNPPGEEYRGKAPEPAAARKIDMGSYESFKLDNGLTVIVVENNKLPRIGIQLSVDEPHLFSEGKFAGAAEMAGALMSRGTKTRTKAQFDQEVDYIGSNFSASSGGAFIGGLSKHTNKMFELIADAALNPTFPQAEFDKVKKQKLGELAQAKDSPDAIAGNVSSVLRNGSTHPYGELVTEETIENLTPAKAREFHKRAFVPNHSYLVIVGDIKTADAKAKAQQYFGKWAKGGIKGKDYPVPSAPRARNVAFVDKAGAVQSVINVTYPVDLTLGDQDYIAGMVMNGVLGGGVFSGRLMQNLREDKAYTYGARSALRGDKFVGRFVASASVRNEVTDSSVTEFLKEMERMRNEPVTKDELQLVKNYMSGSFARGLENPQTVARYALNTYRYNLPKDYYETYLQKLNAVTIADVQRVAREYIRPDNAYVVVVGNKDEVAGKLGQFARTGNVDYYDMYGRAVEVKESAIPEGMTAEAVIEDYIEAIGGEKKLRAVTDMTMTMQAEMQGQKITMVSKQKAPNKYIQEVQMMGMTVQKMTFDGTKGKQDGMQGSKDLEGDELESMKQQAVMFPELDYAKLGYKLELKGQENLEGKDVYRVQITDPKGDKTTEYFDTKTHLKVMTLSTQDQPQQDGTTKPVTVSNKILDYKEVDGIKVPSKISMTGMMPMPLEMNVSDVKVNSGIKDEEFMIK